MVAMPPRYFPATDRLRKVLRNFLVAARLEMQRMPAKRAVGVQQAHVDIAQQAVEAARIKYAAGKVPQQDILKAQISVTRLVEHLIHFEQDIEVAQAHLDTLIGHDPHEPINVHGDYGISIVGVYRPADGQIKEVEGSTGVSPIDAPSSTRALEATFANDWFKTITNEVFG